MGRGKDRRAHFLIFPDRWAEFLLDVADARLVSLKQWSFVDDECHTKELAWLYRC